MPDPHGGCASQISPKNLGDWGHRRHGAPFNRLAAPVAFLPLSCGQSICTNSVDLLRNIDVGHSSVAAKDALWCNFTASLWTPLHNSFSVQTHVVGHARSIVASLHAAGTQFGLTMSVKACTFTWLCLACRLHGCPSSWCSSCVG